MKLILDSKNVLKAAFFAFVFFLLSSRLVAHLDLAEVHQDEHDFVERARYFDLFAKGDFGNLEWRNTSAYDQPPLAYYVYGFTLISQGYRDLAAEQKRIGFNETPSEVKVLGDSPEKELPWWVIVKMIQDARIGAAAFMVGCLVLVYFLGKEVGGYLTGMLAMGIFGLNPLVFYTGRHAMADPILVFFILAAVLSILSAVKHFFKEEIGKFLLFSALVGFFSALAASAKLNGGMVFFFWVLLMVTGLVYLLVKRKRGNGIVAAVDAFLISLLITFNTFVFFNPFLYQNPLVNSWRMIEHRLMIGKYQQLIYPADAADLLPKKVNLIISNTLLPVERDGFTNFHILGLDLLLFLTGLVLLIKTDSGAVPKVVFLWIIFTFICVSIYLPIDWIRYYLPLIPCIAISQALTLGSFLQFFSLRFKKIRL